MLTAHSPAASSVLAAVRAFALALCDGLRTRRLGLGAGASSAAVTTGGGRRPAAMARSGRRRGRAMAMAAPARAISIVNIATKPTHAAPVSNVGGGEMLGRRGGGRGGGKAFAPIDQSTRDSCDLTELTLGVVLGGEGIGGCGDGGGGAIARGDGGGGGDGGACGSAGGDFDARMGAPGVPAQFESNAPGASIESLAWRASRRAW